MNPVRPLQKYFGFVEIYSLWNIAVVGKITGFGGLTG